MKTIANSKYYNMFLRGATLFLKFLFVFCAAKFWSPEDLGLYGLIVTIVGLSGYLVGFDFYVNTQRAFAGSSLSIKNKTISNHVFLTIVLFLLLGPSLYLYLINFSISTKYYFVIFLLIFVEQINLEFSRLLVLKNRQLLVSKLLFFRHGAFPVVFFVLCVFDIVISVPVVLILWSVFSSISAFLAYYFYKKIEIFKISFSFVDFPLLREQSKIALLFLIGTIALRGLFSIDRMIIADYISIEVLGIYTFYVGLSSAVIALYDATFVVYQLPYIFELKRENNIKKIQSLKRKSFIQCFCFYSVALLIYIVTIDIVLFFIGRDEYSSNKWIFLPLLLSAFFYSMSSVYNNIIYVFERSDFLLSSIPVFSLGVFIALLSTYEKVNLWAVLFTLIVAFVSFCLFKILLSFYILRNEKIKTT